MCAILYADTRVWCPGESVFPTVYTGPTSETNFSGRSFQPDRGPDRTEIFVQYPAHRLKGKVDVEARQEDIRKVLDELLNPLGLTYILNSNHIVVKQADAAAPQEKR